MKAQCIGRTAREGGFVPWLLGPKRVFEHIILFGTSQPEIFGWEWHVSCIGLIRSPLTIHSLLQSLRYTTRLLLKAPGFTITAVLILGFGIGVNTAIFSLINTVLLNPLTVPRPDQLVQIFQPQENDPETLV